LRGNPEDNLVISSTGESLAAGSALSTSAESGVQIDTRYLHVRPLKMGHNQA
jgi:hypothetical protein